MSIEVCPICDIAGCRHIRERADLTAAKDARIAELERQLAEAREVIERIWLEALPVYRARMVAKTVETIAELANNYLKEPKP